MKTIITMATLASLLVGLSSASLASPTASPWLIPAPQLQIAEGGSARTLLQQQHMHALAEQRDVADEGQRFAKLLEEQPTAAGNMDKSSPPMEAPMVPVYTSPILRDRAIYGTPH